MPELCVIQGDGVGREVIPAAVHVLQAVLPDLQVKECQAGWSTFEAYGKALPDETLATAKRCGAVLFGAVSSPSRRVPGYRSPILDLRTELDLYANLRPTRSGPGGKPGVELLIVRENSEDLYVRRERREGEVAIAERVISTQASERIARMAFQLAEHTGRSKVTVIHKANVLSVTDGLFRETALDVAAQFPAIACEEMLVDVAAYWLARDPARFDLLLAPNLYGDILSDLAAAWAGGLGMAPSLSLGERHALAEPVHGSAPDIAGRGLANPVGAILSAAMLTRFWWKQPEVADRIEQAVQQVIDDGIRTADIAEGGQHVSTEAFAAQVLGRLGRSPSP